jgi:hypothetical protein
MALPMPEDRWLTPGDIRRLLKKALEDPLFGRRLILVTTSIMHKKTFHGLPLTSVFEPLDFVQKAILKVLCGERRLRADKPNEFASSLISCIESEISNTVTLKESGTTATIDLTPTNVSHRAIAEVVQSIEDDLQHRQFQAEMLTLFKVDSKMEALAQLAMTDGIHGRKDFAIALGISEREVTNLKKRMQRIYLKHVKRIVREKEHHV